MNKIGIVTYIKDDNYGEELQAYAMQHYLNSKGYDAEVIDLEKRVKHLAASKDAIIPAIRNRFAMYGWKAPFLILQKVFDVLAKGAKDKKEKEYKQQFHQLFVDFFDRYTKHSEKYYTLEEIRETPRLDYDTYIAGSDQIWNYMHTDFLDVFFLEFAKKFEAKRVSYAASISVPSIPKSMHGQYEKLIDNIQHLSVRELQGAKLLQDQFGKGAEVVLDPTLLLNQQDWEQTIAVHPYKNEKYVLVYTLSRSKYISKLAKHIAKELHCEKVILIVGDRTYVETEDEKVQIMVNPSEWVGLMMDASYVVTDSFHGTAFSINFNRPFTTLVNPVSNMNSRVMSILEITNLKNRIIYDDGNDRLPAELKVDFSSVNRIINEWREKSEKFLNTALQA